MSDSVIENSRQQGRHGAPSERMRVKRLANRGHYDREPIYQILDAALVAHIGYVIDGQPYVTPTAHWRHGDYVYWHGSSASRMLRAEQTGIPICLTVSLIDGLIFARSAFHHSMNYRSVMAVGTAEVVADEAEKRAALDHFINRLSPGRAEQSRPANAQELKATTVLRLSLDEAVAKVRTGGAVDDAADMALPYWAGVVPLTLAAGQPIPDGQLAAGAPDSLPLPDWLPKS